MVTSWAWLRVLLQRVYSVTGHFAPVCKRLLSPVGIVLWRTGTKPRNLLANEHL